jgi:hypothetical protein
MNLLARVCEKEDGYYMNGWCGEGGAEHVSFEYS